MKNIPKFVYLEVELKGKVQKVTVSNLLTDSPAALVQGAYGVSPTMQRYMKAQSVASGGDGMSGLGGMNQAILEINPKHPIVQELGKRVKADKESPETKDFALLMYDVASMTGGYEVPDTGSFAQRVLSLMTSSAGIDNGVEDATVVQEETKEEKKEEENNDDDADKPIEPEVVA